MDETYPISVYVGTYPRGTWEFVEEFSGAFEDACKRAADLEKQDKRQSIAYRIWDGREG